MKLYFRRFTDLHLLFLEFLSQLLGVSNRSLYKFSDFLELEKKFCHMSLACRIFLPPNHFYTLPASPTTKCFHLEYAKVIWCGDTHDLVGHIFRLSMEPIVLSVVATAVEKVAMTRPASLCSNGRSFLLEDSVHVKVAFSLFRLWGQFLAESLFKCPWNSPQECTSILVSASWSATACLLALFLPPHTSKVERRCSRGIQAPQGA